MKAVVAAFNQEKALVGAFSVITNFRMEVIQALANTSDNLPSCISMQCQAGQVYTLRVTETAAGTLQPLPQIIALY